jgi:methylated-DNA-[protein]-cysteine S-methyltransferase
MPKQSKKATDLLNNEVFTWLSPVGLLEISLSDEKIMSISLVGHQAPQQPMSSSLHEQIAAQLQEYFQKQRHLFELSLDWNQGTPFQQKVWRALTKIPYGKTQSYADIARAIGQPNALRAVGQAIGQNPWLIVVPCHRVIASSGKIGGFSSGIETKKLLLKTESALES